MDKSKGNNGLIVLIIVLAVVTLIAIAVAAYLWGKNKGATTQTSSPVATTKTTSTPKSSAKTTTTPSGIATTASSQAEETPKEVVENFMNYTLGTLPGAQIDYEKARAYLADNMQAQYSGDRWVQDFYGIQDGPDSVNFILENPTEEGKVLRYDAIWGNEVGVGWAFTLEQDNNKWYIVGFSNNAQ